MQSALETVAYTLPCAAVLGLRVPRLAALLYCASLTTRTSLTLQRSGLRAASPTRSAT